MRCPYCQHPDSKVIDSRDVEAGIRRRRECLNCQSRFTTYERIEAQALYVIKKDGRREEFDRSKLLAGVRTACAKRPLPTGTVDRLVNEVEAELHRLGRAEVASALIGELVMERLKALDQIAYVRFASVYREFTDLESLRREVETLAAGRESGRPPATQLPLLPEEPRGRGRRGRRPRNQTS
ncbi:MAG: transcriptional repressor NrdR [Chloroflexi bacterium]|nr:transcriptional repressor NrdR [Chloroflexota bacterium]